MNTVESHTSTHVSNSEPAIIPSLAVIVPCYNEAEVLQFTLETLESEIHSLISQGKITSESFVYYVDDGSRDATWSIIETAAQQYQHVRGIRLSNNCGHQNALLAGLFSTSENVCITIDADLQDDPRLMAKMLEDHAQGRDLVFAVRDTRETDTWFKRNSAQAYYRFMSALGVDLVFNHADYRLMSRRAVDALQRYPEAEMFLRGIVRHLGFKTSKVTYARTERKAGETKYPLRKMLSFAWEGISSFSTVPLRAITVLGFISGWLTVFVLVWVLGIRLFTEQAIPGWASILLPVLFIGSVQLICIGVLGEYIAKIYTEVKRRPRYHIDYAIGIKSRPEHENNKYDL